MRQEKKRPDRGRTAATPHHADDPQVAEPQRVDLPLPPERREEVTLPAGVDGRSLADGRL